MPTAKQMQLRQERIEEYVDNIGDIDSIEEIPKNFQVAVCSLALARDLINVDNVPPRIAGEVAEHFVKTASDRKRDTAATRGTLFHKIAEDIVNGEQVTIPENVAGHYESWKQWVREWEMEFVENEFSVYSETHGYAGTGDFMGFSHKYPELGLILGDYKTSESGIWPDIALQLAGIAYADFIGRHHLDYREDAIPQFKTFVGVQITENGYRVIKVRVSIHTFNTFLSAMNIARWKTEGEGFALDKSAPFVEREIK